jgi:hypothetical protein
VDNTQSNITRASYSPEYITPTQQISWLLDYTDIEGTRLRFRNIAYSNHSSQSINCAQTDLTM